MFHLHDTTRRRIGLAAFVLTGLLPALGIVAWCVERRLPSNVAVEAEQLSQRLGLLVRLAGVEYPRPGAVRYQNVVLADPETLRPIFRCRSLEFAWRAAGDEPDLKSGNPLLAVTVRQPRMDATSITEAWRWLQGFLENRFGRSAADLRLTAEEWTLCGAEHCRTLPGLRATVETQAAGTDIQIAFWTSDAREPIRLRIIRDRQASPPASGFEFYTGDTELPCDLALGFLDLQALGPQCRFRGYIWGKETPDGWMGEIPAAQLTNLDFGALVSAFFPHRTSGIGSLVIQSARFRRGRLEEGNMILSVGPGSLDRSLIAACVEQLGLAVNVAAVPDGDRIPYRQLAASVVFDARGLRLQGRCEDVEPGTILSDGRRRLLGEPPQQPRPIAALVQILAPRGAEIVPISRQTEWLLRHLPLPEAAQPVTARASDTRPR